MGRLGDILVLMLRHGVTALVAITATILIGKWSSVFTERRIEVIDPSEAVLMFVRHVGVDQSEADYGDQVRLFHDRLIAEVKLYAAQTGAVILNSAVVLEGAPDITEELVSRALRSKLELTDLSTGTSFRLVANE